MTQTLNGKHAVVTGGSRGIGKAIAATLAQAGATVTIMGRSKKTLEPTAKAVKATYTVTVDVTQPESVANAFKQIPPVDILINNAGAAETAPFHRTDMDLWQRMLDVNLTGTYLCSRVVAKNMVDHGYGRIINVASTAGLTGYAYVSAYCAAKHGVIGLTRSMAIEYAKKGVTVNAVCPGYTDTDIVSNAVENIVSKTGRTEQQAIAELVRHNPQERLIQPEEVAQTVLWLCDDNSSAITGQSIAIAGGEVL